MPSVPSHKKRLRQDIGNESPAKRQRKSSKLEHLQDKVKEKSEQLDFYLTKALTFLPTDASALEAKDFIEDARFFFRLASEGYALRKMATFLERDSETIFSGVTPQVEPDRLILYTAVLETIDNTGKQLRAALLECAEEMENPSAIDEVEDNQTVTKIHKCHPSPSTAAKNSVLVSNQNSTSPNAVWNGRPTTLTGPCLSIYHPIFQTFMQEYSAEIEPQKMSLDDFQAAKELIDHSAEYYRCEDSRLRKISPHLSHFLGKNITWGGKLNSGHKEWAPDGHIMIYCPLCEDEALLPISLHIEIKNAPGDTDPVEQAQHDAFSLYTAPAMEKLRTQSCMPGFLLGIIGPNIKIAGIIYLEHQPVKSPDKPVPCIISTTLIGYNDLVPSLPSTQLDKKYASHYDQFVWHTAHSLRTLRKCLDMLEQEYKTMREDTVTICKDVRLPAPHFRIFTSEGIKYTLTYHKHLLDDPHGSRSLFLAEANADSKPAIKCVVKFTERYNKRAHEIMAHTNVAAKLLYCAWEQTVGLWVVITAYYNCDPHAPLSVEAIEHLETGLQALHSQNLVHGDIRRPNILVDGNGHPRLIDFDWCGEVGQARYPAHLNTELEWPMGAKAGGLIELGHDMTMLEKLKGASK